MQWYWVCPDKSIGKESVPRRCDAIDLEHRIPTFMDLAETEDTLLSIVLRKEPMLACWSFETRERSALIKP